MANTPLESLESSETTSALETIDINAICERRVVDAATLISCIRQDVDKNIPIVLPVILKYIPRNGRVTTDDLVTIKEILKAGVHATLDSKPAVSISYVKAIELCTAELRTRGVAV